MSACFHSCSRIVMGVDSNRFVPDTDVSVITIAKEGGPVDVLQSLQTQIYARPFEIIVVQGGNRSQARNHGIARSKARLISFIDADCEAPSRWLADLVAALPEDHVVAGVGGANRGRKSSPSLERAIEAVFSTYVGSLNSPSLIAASKSQRRFVKALACVNCVYRRSALIEVGGFDDRFELNEDTEVSARLRKKGYGLIFDSSISVHHRRRGSFSSFARQFFSYGVGRARSMLTNRGCIDGRILGFFLTTILVILTSSVFPLLLPASLSCYCILISGSSFLGGRRTMAMSLFPAIFALFVVEHLSYWIGLVCGVFSGPWKEIEAPESIRTTRYLVSPNSNVRT